MLINVNPTSSPAHLFAIRGMKKSGIPSNKNKKINTKLSSNWNPNGYENFADSTGTVHSFLNFLTSFYKPSRELILLISKGIFFRFFTPQDF